MITIDFNNFGKSIRQTQKEETALYRRHLSNSGMEELSKDDFLKMLEDLNYKIDKSMCTTYYNNYNSMNYLAYGLSYTDKKKKQLSEKEMMAEAIRLSELDATLYSNKLKSM